MCGSVWFCGIVWFYVVGDVRGEWCCLATCGVRLCNVWWCVESDFLFVAVLRPTKLCLYLLMKNFEGISEMKNATHGLFDKRKPQIVVRLIKNPCKSRTTKGNCLGAKIVALTLTGVKTHAEFEFYIKSLSPALKMVVTASLSSKKNVKISKNLSFTPKTSR
jgi:hypothetical protein